VRPRRLVGGFVVALLACRSRADNPGAPAEPATPSRTEASAAAPAAVADLAEPFSFASNPAPGGGPRPQASASGPARFLFDFEDADLPELVEVVSAITGKRFLYSGAIPRLHATLRSPDRVTAHEAYRAFLTILQANGLTVVERGRISNIVASASLINR
jgi:type II secretory pathway component GspD/PulD (secretin)